MAIASRAPGVGELLRDWRQRRRMSQLDLSVEASVSSRHLSFVETGRSKPSRELVLHLAEHLDVPLRERNALLLAAGYSPAFRETPLDAGELAPVRAAIDRVLGAHEPFPAVVVDRRSDLVSANAALLQPPCNTLRVSLHPDGLAPRIANLAEYGAHLLLRLDRQAALSGDPDLVALGEELRGYQGVTAGPAMAVDAAALVFVPLVLRGDAGELTFFSTLTTFGTALDITVAELAIEAFFPADDHTASVLREGWQTGG